MFRHGTDAEASVIERKNVEHYRHLLETVTDENERARILELLKAEQQKRKTRTTKICSTMGSSSIRGRLSWRHLFRD